MSIKTCRLTFTEVDNAISSSHPEREDYDYADKNGYYDQN